MTPSDWIKIASLVVDIIKTMITFGVVFLIFWLFKKEIRTLIKNGGLKLAVPGFSLETIQKQQEELGTKEKKEIKALNSELEKSKKAEKILHELQEYTARDKDTLFLGYHFEKTYRLIFPSQMVILNSMTNFNGEIPDALAQALFRRTIWAQQFNISYEQFMGFLIQSGLIAYDPSSSKFTLIPLGRTFWEYLVSNNIPLKIPAYDVITAPAE
ncbi:hypothetical protein A3A14_01940 [Candidatus Daviesbacteria bacterium RIFCSPLOWO2_01_FULL_43_38]|uniref:Uncharacterized protein n=2 Tax=Candidatus Daviesiibacteriota TaxID=1752718 RepID=A0A1F5K0R9_9BACT|nr:MAG: hypothetical protein UV41_C0008G0007 [Candidatus Daviesbacteria bacterium GW2011_GWA2_42_7]OGE19812.1 MAG: hypothetical protein A2874_02700 [Candidatus Daviesbacteria bacterium RIFCSPHIGHO2_01_FULL_43_17]OGE34597.1 MAG: hypothetical protein A3E45_00660 [Candidatus Daviesbacteria bacterium RIFCSPHIGHO2_12_FULL_43_11]OGE63615.1 MAG: hypothetical protein A3A14_01940 [Candidatus Daviesbacteria bacterium RIFCSPLOWO2_01_FULL_43_38]